MDAHNLDQIRLLYRDYCPLDKISYLAIHYLKCAEEKGDVESLYRLSECYRLLARLSGWVGNQVMVFDADESCMMIDSKNVDKYRELSRQYYDKALSAREPHACFCEYEKRISDVQNLTYDIDRADKRTMQYLQYASDQGHPLAMYELSKWLQKTEPEESKRLLQRALQYRCVMDIHKRTVDNACAESRRRRLSDIGCYDFEPDNVREDMGPWTNWPDRG